MTKRPRVQIRVTDMQNRTEQTAKTKSWMGVSQGFCLLFYELLYLPPRLCSVLFLFLFSLTLETKQYIVQDSLASSGHSARQSLSIHTHY